MFSRTQETDPRFEALTEALSLYSGRAKVSTDVLDTQLQAAVSVVLRGTPGLEVLLIKRAHFNRAPWSGHMALPGGRRERNDIDLLQTAMRETMEETALDLEQGAQHLGRLKDLKPNSVRLPRLTITPFVFGVGRNAQASVASPEIDQVFWVAVDELRTPTAQSHVEIHLSGSQKQEFPCYLVEEEPVWGLTYRVLSQLLEVYT